MFPRKRSARWHSSLRQTCFRPALEVLEERLAPSVASPNFFPIHPNQFPTPAAAGGFYPDQIRTAYGINNTSDNGPGILFGATAGDGSGQTIAIVDAYDDPNILTDVDTFDQALSATNGGPTLYTQYGAASTFLNVFNQNGVNITAQIGSPGTGTSPNEVPSLDPTPPPNSWAGEVSLDVEWAHSIAPAAQIDLILADDASNNLFTAVTAATNLPGVTVISNSWGGSESPTDPSLNSTFTSPNPATQGITFLASTGDSGAPSGYPAYSPNVVGVGGTSLTLNANNTYNSETAWNLVAGSGGAGGISQYETEPAYQINAATANPVYDAKLASSLTGGMRTNPDVSFLADPNTGVDACDSYDYPPATPWEVVGGTSLSSPSWGALIAIANQGRALLGANPLDGPSQTLPDLYSIPTSDYHDVTSGNIGLGYTAGPGYDYATGLGSPRANLLIPDLAAWGEASQLVLTGPPPSTVPAGVAFGLTVTAEDSAGGVDASVNGSFTVTVASGPGVLTGGPLTVTAVDGVTSFSGLTLDTIGTYTLTVTGGTLSTTTNTITVTVGPPAQLKVVTEPPGTITAGTGFGLSVEALDAGGNLVTAFSGSVTVGVQTGPGTIGGIVTVSAFGGIATFSGLTLDTAGTYTLVTTSTGLTGATTTSITVQAGPVSQLGISTQPPASVAAGSGFGLVVESVDQFGNLVPSYNGQVTIAVATGPSTALGGTLTLTAHNGKVSFSGLTLTIAGTYTIQATAPASAGLGPATTNSFLVTAGAATQLFVQTEPPANANRGFAFGPVVVGAEDKYGNVVTNFAGLVRISVASGPTTLIGGTTTATAVAGVATFPGLILNTAGTYVLLASSTGLVSVKTTPVNVFGALSTTATLGGTLGSNGWYVSSVLVTLKASGGFNGVQATYYSLDPVGPPTTFALYTGPITVSANGPHTLYWYSVDNAGTQETTHGPLAFKIDTTVPATSATLTGTPGNPGYYLSAVSVTLTATAGVSGVAHTYYTVDNGVLRLYAGPFAVATQGNNTLTFYTVDNNGLKESVNTMTFGINSTTPTLTITATPVNSASPTIAGSPEGTVSGTTAPGATVNVAVSDSAAPANVVTAQAVANIYGKWSLLYNAGSLLDGILSIAATVTDAAGHNVSGSKTTTKSMEVDVTYVHQPQAVLAGVYAAPITVQLRDAFGNALAMSGETLNLAAPGATFTGPLSAMTNALGQATFSKLLFSSAGTFDLMISGNGMNTGQSSSFTVGKQNLLFWR